MSRKKHKIILSMAISLGFSFFLWFSFCARTSLGVKSTSIRQFGFDDFVSGRFGNSGANLYVSRNGRVQVINKWDLNSDGYVDVLISNDHDVFETVDAFIYWRTEHGYTSALPDLWPERPLAQVMFDLMEKGSNLTRIPTFGGGRSVIADLNRDGYPEIIFCNYIHNYPGLRTAFVYWGSPQGYRANNKTELPTNWASGVTVADLNRDGYPELVFVNQGVEEGSEDISPHAGFDSYIYWGSPTGFDPAHPTLLLTHGAKDVTVADVNKDGYPDLAFINSSLRAKEVQVFWGSATGYSNDRTQSLQIPDPTSIESADLNRDGFEDLVITTVAKIEIGPDKGLARRQNQAQQAVYILMGSAKGLDSQQTIHLPTYEARDSCIGDFNLDGFLDIAIANASSGFSPVTFSFIYWGSATGFSAQQRAELATLGASGVASADLNQDGYPDLIFANSNDGESYDVPSYI